MIIYVVISIVTDKKQSITEFCDRNCDQFVNLEEANICIKYNDGLDKDKDGVACEILDK